jgi:hypothetical protein
MMQLFVAGLKGISGGTDGPALFSTPMAVEMEEKLRFSLNKP